jgi:2-oxoglutarate ferredoxin oxidoreductase subunit gamma
VAERVEVRITGLGGQGVVLAGVILGKAAVYDGKYAVQTQSYGAEARGSAAKSEVIISDKTINFPKVRKCDVLVAMSQSALDRHIKDLKGNGLLLVDRNMVKEIPRTKADVIQIAATKIAETELQSRIYTNMIMLGALTRTTNLASKEAMQKAIVDSVPEDTRDNNLKGFEKGYLSHK